MGKNSAVNLFLIVDCDGVKKPPFTPFDDSSVGPGGTVVNRISSREEWETSLQWHDHHPGSREGHGT